MAQAVSALQFIIQPTIILGGFYFLFRSYTSSASMQMALIAASTKEQVEACKQQVACIGASTKDQVASIGASTKEQVASIGASTKEQVASVKEVASLALSQQKRLEELFSKYIEHQK